MKALKRVLQTDDERLKKWMNVMVNNFMSSEESWEKDDTFGIRPLPWRSFKVNEFFGRLDNFLYTVSLPLPSTTLRWRELLKASMNS